VLLYLYHRCDHVLYIYMSALFLSSPCVFSQVAGALACAVVLYGRPLIHLPPDVLVMTERYMAMPHGESFSAYGAIAVIPWMFLCDRACGMLARAMLPARRLVGVPTNKAMGEGKTGLMAEGKKSQ